jgi:phage terminase large subunit GpA-like protein
MWSGIKYELEIDGTVKNVWYECVHCHGRMTERDKMRMVNAGQWIKQNPKVKKHAGFHISELYSPLSTWKKIVVDFLDAKKDTETLRVWVNTVLGDLWEETDNLGLNAAMFADRIEEYDKILPDGVLVLTCAVDVQENRVEMIVEGWGKDEENWHIHQQTIPGNFARSSVQRDLAGALDRKFRHASGIEMAIDLVIIDTGYIAQTVYKFVKTQQPLRRIVAVKGFGGPGKKLLHKIQQEKRIRVTLIIAGVDEAKEILYDRLHIDEPGAAYIHFNTQCGNEYFNQLTAERRRTKYKYGHAVKVWEKDRSARNEVLDLKVYNLVAMRFLNVNWDGQRKYIDKIAAALNKPKNDDDDAPPPHKKQPAPLRRKGNSFVTRY